jgi:hypothetical protein
LKISPIGIQGLRSSNIVISSAPLGQMTELAILFAWLDNLEQWPTIYAKESRIILLSEKLVMIWKIAKIPFFEVFLLLFSWTWRRHTANVVPSPTTPPPRFTPDLIAIFLPSSRLHNSLQSLRLQSIIHTQMANRQCFKNGPIIAAFYGIFKSFGRRRITGWPPFHIRYDSGCNSVV